MGLKRRDTGIYEEKPGRFVIQVKGKTKRAQGTLADARRVRAELLLQVDQERQTTSTNGSPVRSASCPSLADWLGGRYADWQLRAQNDRTRRKLESPKRYLVASDLGPLTLDQISTAAINGYVEWRRKVGAISFSTRKDGQRFRARTEAIGAQTINKSLKVLSAALRLACDEEVIAKVPKINFLPEDDARAVLPPTEEQFQALIRAAEQLRALAPLLPEVVELLGEFGLRPGELFHLTWGSVDWNLGQGANRGALRVEEQQRTRMLGAERWIPKNRKYRTIPFTLRGRAILEALHVKASPKADDLVIP